MRAWAGAGGSQAAAAAAPAHKPSSHPRKQKWLGHLCSRAFAPTDLLKSLKSAGIPWISPQTHQGRLSPFPSRRPLLLELHFQSCSAVAVGGGGMKFCYSWGPGSPVLPPPPPPSLQSLCGNGCAHSRSWHCCLKMFCFFNGASAVTKTCL